MSSSLFSMFLFRKAGSSGIIIITIIIIIIIIIIISSSSSSSIIVVMVKVKDKVVTVLIKLITTQLRRIGEWMYRSTSS
jgi:hypothetical protein